jgi:RimJ/RimL family protein N-acetyltransferase
MFHRSERLLLRPGWIEDAPEVTARIAEEAIVRNLARAPWPYREADALAWLSEPVAPLYPRFLLTLPGNGRGAVIGACGLQEAEAGAELGYWIGRDWWGQGLATEAVHAVLAIARMLGHTRLYARHAIDNPASGRVLCKAGFRSTGIVGPCTSAGRGAAVPAPEYVAELMGGSGDADPSALPRAA